MTFSFTFQDTVNDEDNSFENADNSNVDVTSEGEKVNLLNNHTRNVDVLRRNQ